MKNPFRSLVLFFLLPLATLLGASRPAETIILAPGHQVSIAVPEGYVYSSGRNDDDGTIVAKIVDPRGKNDLEVQFRPDPDSRVGAEQQQIAFLAEACREFAEGSVEKSYDFKPLAPRSGNGTFCSFTDASLVGHPPPKGEFLHVTKGVKAWPGWAIVFTLLSNDAASKEYQTLLALVKESFDEKPAAAPAKS